MYIMYVAENINIKHVPTLVLAILCLYHLAGHALAGNGGPVLSCGDSLAWSSRNVCTQLPKFPVTTTPVPCFKTPTAFVVYIWQNHTLPLYLSLLNPAELPSEGKHNTNLVQKR